MDRIYKSHKTSNINFHQSRILVVEDSDDHWAIIKSAIEEKLPEVEAVRAVDTGEAKEFLYSCRNENARLPNLILLDLYVPKREDGWQLLADLKGEGSPYLQVPVMVLSFSDDVNDVSEVYKYGATAYLVKPLNYKRWLDYFETLRQYWWNTVTLPGDQF